MFAKAITLHSAKAYPAIEKMFKHSFSGILGYKQYHTRLLLGSFPNNGHTALLRTDTKKGVLWAKLRFGYEQRRRIG